MITAIVYDILSKDEELKGILGGDNKIFNLISPRDKDGTYVIFSSQGEPTYAKTKHPIYNDYVTVFDIYSHSDIVSVVEASDRIQFLLEDSINKELAGKKLKKAELLSWDEGIYEDGFVERTMTFSFRVNN